MTDGDSDHKSQRKDRDQLSITCKVEDLVQLERAAQTVLDFVEKTRAKLSIATECSPKPVGDSSSMKDQFCIVLSDDLEHLRAAILKEDWSDIAQKANQAAGDAGLYGLKDVSHLARKLENLAHERDSVGALESLETLADALLACK